MSAPSELVAVVERLVAVARRRRVPADIIGEAEAATLRTIGSVSGPSGLLECRAHSYFEAVVRRRLVRRPAAKEAVARVVAGGVIADLLASGRTPGDAWAAFEHGWAAAMPPEVVAEYRARLCA